METVTERVLRAAGISATLITTVVVIGGAFFIYKTFLDTKLVNLQIDKLKREKAAA